ncbi:FUSC family protein [Shewanella glacialipiscicola]|nr:FUSC family protein [Shewanella glacialipiscicola]MCL1085389.1 FUSC family protein [Shewanella glacialipiscicola]
MLLLQSLFFPDRRTIIFAVKGVISMTLALYVAMFLNLERPYWALVSAIFLQVRPESGLVIEKGLCQIGGNLVGALVGIMILNGFAPYPTLALGLLACWIGLNSGLSAMMRQQNFVYAFAMAGMTACLVVLIVMASPNTADSAKIFEVAQARISEIIVGAICAVLVSQLLWPVKVKHSLQLRAKNTINQTLSYLALELDPTGSHASRHEHIDTILESISTLSDDASAVIYEGPEGRGQNHAVNFLCNKTLSLLAVIQIFGRLQRNHPQLVSEPLAKILENMRSRFTLMAQSSDYQECYKMARSLRHQLQQNLMQYQSKTPLETRLIKATMELSADLIMVLKSYNVLTSNSVANLNAPPMEFHRDPLIGLTTGLRSMAVFVIGASLWIGTGSNAVLMMILLPVVFSIMMARQPLPMLTTGLRHILVGIIIIVPVTIFYALPLLAQSSGDFEILILVLAGPFFIGLLALANRPTLPYGLGICVPFAVLVQPSNNISFAIENTISNALAIFVGVTVLYWLFKLITQPSERLMQYRLLQSIQKDLVNLAQRPDPTSWFNARMGDRLLRIATYEKGSGHSSRVFTDLAFTAFNLGNVSIRLRRILQGIPAVHLESALHLWQLSLGKAFITCAQGKVAKEFALSCETLLQELSKSPLPPEELTMIEGMFERINLTFERTAHTIAEQKEATEK